MNGESCALTPPAYAAAPAGAPDGQQWMQEPRGGDQVSGIGSGVSNSRCGCGCADIKEHPCMSDCVYLTNTECTSVLIIVPCTSSFSIHLRNKGLLCYAHTWVLFLDACRWDAVTGPVGGGLGDFDQRSRQVGMCVSVYARAIKCQCWMPTGVRNQLEACIS